MKSHYTHIEQGYDPYQLLRVYTYYRVLLGSLLLLIYESNLLPNLLGSEHGSVFFYTCWVYTGVNVLSLINLWRTHTSPSTKQRFFAVVFDVFAITLMMFASGGATSGLGYLMIVSVAAAGMLVPAQLAILSAAMATIALIGESIVHHAISGIDTRSLFVAGSLGALIFLTALAFQYVTGKIRRSTAELQAQAEHVAHLQKLARLIVERMRTGIVVLNRQDDIELINNAAQSLLGVDSSDGLSVTLDNLPAIKQPLQQWRKSRDNKQGSTVVPAHGKSGNDLRVSVANLELGKDEDTLVFIEDNRAIAQQAQQLKLASLGRLTASIAHEIRNPLSAISHASQLLDESPEVCSADRRLLEIISNHTRRVNQIIENILHVSRRKPAAPATIELVDWSKRYLAEYQSGENNIGVKHEDEHVFAQFDPSQLHQIVTNLLNNAMRYARLDESDNAIQLIIGIDPNRDTPFLKVIDNGPGIPRADRKHVFEPFFTTESSGSGLGLFICKELCEANQAFIEYSQDQHSASCFTIRFAHPDKVQK